MLLLLLLLLLTRVVCLVELWRLSIVMPMRQSQTPLQLLQHP
jgi:hypothetical protein